MRFRTLRLDRGGEIAAVLAGLGRPVLLDELERRGESAARGTGRLHRRGRPWCWRRCARRRALEALLVADERPDGRAWSAGDRDALAMLCDLAAIA